LIVDVSPFNGGRYYSCLVDHHFRTIAANSLPNIAANSLLSMPRNPGHNYCGRLLWYRR
jgi:hypothetical protein